jgi:hypothetical protein
MEIKRVVVLGAGGVGFWLTIALCRDWPDVEKIVYDSDTFEGGFGRFRLPAVSDPKQLKVQKLSGFVRMVMGDRAPIIESKKLTAADAVFWSVELSKQTLVVDATDMGLKDRKHLWAVLRECGCQLLRVSYDGNGCVVIARGLPFCASDAGGYAMVPTLAQSMLAGGLGAEAVGILLQGYDIEDYQVQVPKMDKVQKMAGEEGK